MITRCPSCQTAFRVTDAQLAAREGQVRCGACDTIFDARAFLVSDTPVAAVQDDDAGYEPFVPDLPVPDMPAADIPIRDAEPAEVPVQPAESDPEPTPASTRPPSAATSTSPAAEATFDFGPAAPRRRGLWVATSLLLLLGLTAQGLFHFRNDIAMLLPEAKPLLKEACSVIGCGISLPRRSDLMSIEASDLQADAANPNVVVLTATLRNRAAFAQAHPALELTLTDSQDLPLARRVLQAGDYLDAPPDNDRGVAPGAERAIKLTLQLADIKATGYRLYLFYP